MTYTQLRSDRFGCENAPAPFAVGDMIKTPSHKCAMMVDRVQPGAYGWRVQIDGGLCEFRADQCSHA